jgi:hypothetical protein
MVVLYLAPSALYSLYLMHCACPRRERTKYDHQPILTQKLNLPVALFFRYLQADYKVEKENGISESSR